MRLKIADFNQIAYNTARFFGAENPGFIIGTGLRKECADFLVDGAHNWSARRRVKVFGEILRSGAPCGAIRSDEVIDLFWFVSVYNEKFLGVSLDTILDGTVDFREYQDQLSGVKLSRVGFESAKARLLELAEKISQAFIKSDEMSYLAKRKLGRELASTVREFLNLTVILAGNSAWLFGESHQEFDLEASLIVGLWRNVKRKQAGQNFHIISADFERNGGYTDKSGFGVGTKDLTSVEDITGSGERVIELKIVDKVHKSDCVLSEFMKQIPHSGFGLAGDNPTKTLSVLRI